MLRLGRAAVDEVGRVGLLRRSERARPDSEQTEFGAVGLAFEEVARGGENSACELRRRAERTGPRANLEIGRFELRVTVEPESAFALSRADTSSA